MTSAVTTTTEGDSMPRNGKKITRRSHRLPMCLLLVIAFACSGAAACGGGSPTSPTVVATPTISYQGAWTGIWVRQSCSETGNAAGSCNTAPNSGSLRLTAAQTSSTVTGNLELGTFLTFVSGVVGSDGSLSLSGQGSVGGITLNITAWRTTMSNNVMTGAFRYTIIPDVFGTVTIGASLQGVVKTS